jgi:hypothetical protein
MRFEIILFIAAGLIIANIYTDGKYLKMAMGWKKYYQMIGVAFGAFVLYILIKKNPLYAKNILITSNDYLKYLPVDKNTSNFISPILDFTAKQNYGNENDNYNYPIMQMNQPRAQNRVMNSGGKSSKRSVSETKKKFVAARQNWRCGKCTKQLPAWFEVDHKIRLEHGGSNHVDNLEALCRDCHGEKTAMENL